MVPDTQITRKQDVQPDTKKTLFSAFCGTQGSVLTPISLNAKSKTGMQNILTNKKLKGQSVSNAHISTSWLKCISILTSDIF